MTELLSSGTGIARSPLLQSGATVSVQKSRRPKGHGKCHPIEHATLCEGRVLSSQEYRSFFLASTSEAEWQKSLIGEPNGKRRRLGLVQAYGYDPVHIFGCVHSRRNRAGLPDLHLRYAKSDTPTWPLLVAELKAEKGDVTDEQANWLDTYVAAGVPTFLWRPSDEAEVRDILFYANGHQLVPYIYGPFSFKSAWINRKGERNANT